MGESITRVQGRIDRFSAELEEDWIFMERRADQEGRKMQNYLGTWMTERVVDPQNIHFEKSNVTVKNNTSRWGSW